MEPSTHKRLTFICLTLLWLTGLAVLLLLNFLTPKNASEEWIYTLKWINIADSLLLFGIAIFLVAWVSRIGLASKRRGKKCLLLTFVVCAILLALPFLMPESQYLSWPYQYFLSICWICTLLILSVGLFALARKRSAFASSLLCLAGSVAMGIAALELVLLCTSQYGDGLENKSSESK